MTAGVIGLVALAALLFATLAFIAGRMADKCDEINQGNPDDEGAAWKPRSITEGRNENRNEV